jgi:type IX secretion system PorP/SprF family membrane protein
MQKKLFFLILPILMLINIQAQDISFSQYYLNRLYLNPAMAGMNKGGRLFLHYRNQWPDLSSSFTSYSVSYDQPVKKIHGGFGAIIINDRQGRGIINHLQASGVYSYHARLSKHSHFKAGVMAGYGQYGFNSQQVYTADMFDPISKDFSSGSGDNIYSQSVGYPDFATGVLFDTWDRQTNILYLFGASCYHLTQPSIIGGTPIPRKYIGHAGLNFPFIYNRLGFEEIRLYPQAAFVKQDQFSVIDYRLLFLLDNYSIGTGLRQNLMFSFSTFIFSFEAFFSNISLSYSYDLIPTQKEVLLSKFGAHEVTIEINFQYKERIKSLKCPKI